MRCDKFTFSGYLSFTVIFRKVWMVCCWKLFWENGVSTKERYRKLYCTFPWMVNSGALWEAAGIIGWRVLVAGGAGCFLGGNTYQAMLSPLQAPLYCQRMESYTITGPGSVSFCKAGNGLLKWVSGDIVGLAVADTCTWPLMNTSSRQHSLIGGHREGQ